MLVIYVLNVGLFGIHAGRSFSEEIIEFNVLLRTVLASELRLSANCFRASGMVLAKGKGMRLMDWRNRRRLINWTGGHVQFSSLNGIGRFRED